MPKKIKIGVLMGGPSAEREISLITGKAIFENLDRKKYNPAVIEMTKQSRFYLPKTKRFIDFINRDRKLFDIIFIALHGTPGEDGTVQGMFDALKIAYTGPGVLSAALAMNKDATAKMYHEHNIPTPPYMTFTKQQWKEASGTVAMEIRNRYGFPVVIKPVNQGSAVGVKIVKSENDLVPAVNSVLKQFDWLMAQEFIAGQEATCGVLEKDGVPFALPPTRIIANANEFYDYNSKYKPGGSTHVCPADFGAQINEKIQDLALKAHQALGCKGMSRTDIFVAHDGQLWVLETNTIPGMTPMSLLPEAAGKAGYSFSAMLDLVIKASL